MTEPLDRKPSPLAGGATEVFLHERASATPDRRPGAHAHPHVRLVPDAQRERDAEEPVPAAPLDLRAAQAWFVDVMTHPDSVERGVARAAWDARAVVTGGPRMAPEDRMRVYHHAYRARLVECLADDYPALAFALGDEAFEALASAYVAAHPSRSPNLNAYGRHMAAFCRTHALDGLREDAQARGVTPAFAADLAALEWALVEVLHAAEAPALSPQGLAEVAPERWEGARLPKNETLRVLHFGYPVNAYFQAWKRDEEPSIPEPAPSATAVYRRGTTLWRMDLTPAMAGLLGALFLGQTLGEALGTIEAAAESPEALAEAERGVMVWFREWVSSGFFARIELPEA